jgi:hypothetical protein
MSLNNVAVLRSIENKGSAPLAERTKLQDVVFKNKPHVDVCHKERISVVIRKLANWFRTHHSPTLSK